MIAAPTDLDLTICREPQTIATAAKVVGHAGNETQAASVSGDRVGSGGVIQFV